ncbi:nitrophenyl compound nitroreductase subunit ArsF family protein [Crateriforma spongiae]|uniref:nitrophenyl compound nitroreductase subunit ArsF family protein n=1 Tax=Crateriforma spongiae TaxID=2724528 RepID=UPI001446CE9B|nr:nitrophenyl compound nitroreductase subunit ArsF family protein [Crateriforma spongiae]
MSRNGLVVGLLVISSWGTHNAMSQTPVKLQSDRVIAMYFHRTQRCPTCKMMGGYSEQAVTKGFAKQMADGTVEFRMIDYEKKENAGLAQAYNVKGPALIVAQIRSDKVRQYKDLNKIWSLVRVKNKFTAYVQSNVKDYMD